MKRLLIPFFVAIVLVVGFAGRKQTKAWETQTLTVHVKTYVPANEIAEIRTAVKSLDDTMNHALSENLDKALGDGWEPFSAFDISVPGSADSSVRHEENLVLRRQK